MDRQLDLETIYEIYRACRLCGASGGYRMPIIQNIVDMGGAEIKLHEKIRECVQIEVHKGDKMPPLVCEPCVDKINDFYEFMQICKQINRRTRLRLGLPLHTLPQPQPAIDNSRSRESRASTSRSSGQSKRETIDCKKPSSRGRRSRSEEGEEIRTTKTQEKKSPISKPLRSAASKKESPTSKKACPASKRACPASKKACPASKRACQASKRACPASKRACPASKKEVSSKKEALSARNKVEAPAAAGRALKRRQEAPHPPQPTVPHKKARFFRTLAPSASEAPLRSEAPGATRCGLCRKRYSTPQALLSHMRHTHRTLHTRTHDIAANKCVAADPTATAATAVSKCAACWALFFSHAQKEAHKCAGKDARPGGKCSICKRTYARLSTLNRHACYTPRQKDGVKVDPGVRKRLLWMRVRIARCDALLSKGGYRCDVSLLPHDYGLDKNVIYPYITSVRKEIKLEPSLSKDTMVNIKQEVDELNNDFIDWDSDGSVASDHSTSLILTKAIIKESVPSLNQLALRVVSDKLLGNLQIHDIKKAMIEDFNEVSYCDTSNIESLIADLDKGYDTDCSGSLINKNERRDSDFESLFKDDGQVTTNDDFDDHFDHNAKTTIPMNVDENTSETDFSDEAKSVKDISDKFSSETKHNISEKDENCPNIDFNEKELENKSTETPIILNDFSTQFNNICDKLNVESSSANNGDENIFNSRTEGENDAIINIESQTDNIVDTDTVSNNESLNTCDQIKETVSGISYGDENTDSENFGQNENVAVSNTETNKNGQNGTDTVNNTHTEDETCGTVNNVYENTDLKSFEQIENVNNTETKIDGENVKDIVNNTDTCTEDDTCGPVNNDFENSGFKNFEQVVKEIVTNTCTDDDNRGTVSDEFGNTMNNPEPSNSTNDHYDDVEDHTVDKADGVETYENSGATVNYDSGINNGKIENVSNVSNLVPNQSETNGQLFNFGDISVKIGELKEKSSDLENVSDTEIDDLVLMNAINAQLGENDTKNIEVDAQKDEKIQLSDFFDTKARKSMDLESISDDDFDFER